MIDVDRDTNERLSRAARSIRPDVDAALTRVRKKARVRDTVRRAGTIAVALAVAVAGVLAAWRLGGFGRETRPAGDGPRTGIAYMRITLRGDDPIFDSYVARSDGSNPVPLETQVASEVFPALSPDGTRVAFAGEVADAAPSPSPEAAPSPSPEPEPTINLYVAARDGSHARAIVEGGTSTSGSLSWSPDGERLAFIRSDPFPNESAVWIVDVDGSDAHRILEGQWEHVAWSPDGDALALAGDPGGETLADAHGIYVVGVDGTGLRQVTFEDQGYDYFPTWSPDGTRIAFVRNENFDDIDFVSDIYSVGVDGGGLERLTDWEGIDTVPVWSPDGEQLLFSTDRALSESRRQRNAERGDISGVSIFVLDVGTREARPLIEGGDAAVFATSWI